MFGWFGWGIQNSKNNLLLYTESVQYLYMEDLFMTIIQRLIPGYTEVDNVTGCCPVFHPEKYDNCVYDLSDYHFIKSSTLSFMYIRLNMDKVFTQALKAISDSNQAYTDRYLILSKDLNPFKCNHYFLVNGNGAGFTRERIEGNYFTKVYDGDFKNISKWNKDFESLIKKQGKNLRETFVFYTTCPNCAKVYGHNYVVLFGKIN